MRKVTLKGLFAHKLRFALTALSVMLGIAFLSGTLVLTDTVRKTFDDLFASVNEGTDAYIRAKESVDSPFGEAQRARISADLLPEIEAVDGVAAADGNLQFYAQLVDQDGDAIGNPDFGAPTFGFNWSDIEELNPFRLEPGSKAPEADDEIVVNQSAAEEGDLKVGDSVQVLTQAAPKTYTLVGIAKFGDTGSAGGSTSTLFTTAEAQRINDADGQFDSISAVAEDGVSETELTRRIREALDDPTLQVMTGAEITKEQQDQIQEGLGFFTIALTVFAGIALFVGMFIILNTFSVTVAQRQRELALLRAIGASGRQVLTSVMAEAFLVGLFASIVGIVAGIGLSVALKGLLDAFGFEIPAGGVVIKPATIIISLVVGTLVTVISAIVPARRAATIPPIAAMRDVAIERTDRNGRRAVIGIAILALGIASMALGLFGDAENGIIYVGVGALIVFIAVFVLGPLFARQLSRVIGAPLPKLRGITGALARQNAMRNPKRTSATAAALMIGVALVGFITIFAASAKRTIDVQVDNALEADYVLTTGGFGFGTFSPDLATEVAALPDVEAVSALRFAQAEFDGSEEFVGGIDPVTVGQVFDLAPQEGDIADLGTDGLAISDTVAEDEGWTVGTDVSTKFPNGTEDLTVVAVYGTGANEGLADYLLSIETFTEQYPSQLDNQVFIKMKPSVDSAEAERSIERVLEAYPNVELQNPSEYKQAQVDQITSILNLIYALLFLAVFIAVIGIANTLALSIYERTREIGLLRAVGMSRSQVRSSIRWESVIIAIFGSILGLVIGLFFGWAVVESLKDEGITEFAPPGGQLLLVLIVAAILGVVAAILPARRAAKLDVLRAVTTE